MAAGFHPIAKRRGAGGVESIGIAGPEQGRNCGQAVWAVGQIFGGDGADRACDLAPDRGHVGSGRLIPFEPAPPIAEYEHEFGPFTDRVSAPPKNLKCRTGKHRKVVRMTKSNRHGGTVLAGRGTMDPRLRRAAGKRDLPLVEQPIAIGRGVLPLQQVGSWLKIARVYKDLDPSGPSGGHHIAHASLPNADFGRRGQRLGCAQEQRTCCSCQEPPQHALQLTAASAATTAACERAPPR